MIFLKMSRYVEECWKRNNRRLSGEKRNQDISLFCVMLGREGNCFDFFHALPAAASMPLVRQGLSAQGASGDTVFHSQGLLGVLAALQGLVVGVRRVLWLRWYSGRKLQRSAIFLLALLWEDALVPLVF